MYVCIPNGGVALKCDGVAGLAWDGRDRTAVLLPWACSKVTFEEEPWRNVSSTAKDFIQKLLKKDPQKRWTAQQVCLCYVYVCVKSVGWGGGCYVCVWGGL